MVGQSVKRPAMERVRCHSVKAAAALRRRLGGAAAWYRVLRCLQDEFVRTKQKHVHSEGVAAHSSSAGRSGLASSAPRQSAEVRAGWWLAGNALGKATGSPSRFSLVPASY
jgi:hypothetical protein